MLREVAYTQKSVWHLLPDSFCMRAMVIGSRSMTPEGRRIPS